MYLIKFNIIKNQNYSIYFTHPHRKIDAESKQQKVFLSLKSSEMTFDRYYQFNEINQYLDRLATKEFTHAKVSVTVAGKSFEGRDIKIVSITNGDGREKNSIFIDAGIHAREWIAPATAIYWLEELLDANSSNSKLLNDLDFVIQPVVNPDGNG